MELKAGVRIFGIRSELVLALTIIEGVYHDYSEMLTVTSMMDGQHRHGSLHYVGAAVDVRLPTASVGAIVLDLKRVLGYDFDVMREPDHIHIEFQPKSRY